MNNLLSYREYFNTMNSYDELNEGDGIIRRVFNKSIQNYVKSQLSDEIEMSKQVMDGIKTGLESLNDNFEEIKNGLNDDENEVKGEKQKLLDSITKILDNSRKTTWNLSELIDEGEIDYAGFTANAGISTVALFGVLLSPIRTSFILHKGYNYFFTLIKNTIRKSLVMLQLNFDQFENLIITKSFQSEDFLRDRDVSNEISEFYGNIYGQLFDEKTGLMKSKRGKKDMEQALRMANDKFKNQMQANKQIQSSRNAYDCLDMYQNTYTKSLETLRTYSQEDVQKQLDAIKNTMTKIAAGDTDLTAYGEMICAAAEEHAYKVSSSIYGKFAKMTEVFSLPNQKKMIDLIQEATLEKEKEAEDRRKKEMDDDYYKSKMDEIDGLNKDGEEIFKSVSGSTVDELDKDNKYSHINASNWTYDEYNKLDSEKKDIFEKWLGAHPEVLKKCDPSLKVVIINSNNNGYLKYVDTLVDYIKPALKVKSEEVKEGQVKSFIDYIIEEDNKNIRKTSSRKTKKIFVKSKEKESETHKENRYYIDFEDLEDNIKRVIKDDFNKDNGVALAALETINKNLLRKVSWKHETIESFIDKIGDAYSKGKVNISSTLYDIINSSIDELKEQRSHDYPILNGNGESGNSNKQKSEE